MLGSKLKKYRLVFVNGLGAIRTDEGLIDLASITDEQAGRLYESGSRYVEKVEKPATRKRK